MRRAAACLAATAQPVPAGLPALRHHPSLLRLPCPPWPTLQDITFFDTHASTADLLHVLREDTVAYQARGVGATRRLVGRRGSGSL